MITFLAPGFAWAFLIPAGIVVLYLLKRRYEPRGVPSLFLWRKSLQDTAASHPFQRLRKNLLLPLQVLAAVLLALGLMRPSLTGGAAGKSVLIIDVSASMMTRSEGKTRLEEAKEQAREMIRDLPAGEEITVLTAGDQVTRVILNTTDKDAAEKAVGGVTAARGGADWTKALNLAEAIGKEETGKPENAGAAITVFSDMFIPPAGVSAVNVGKGEANRAIYALTAENGKAYARVANYGPACTVTLACEADGELCGARELELPEGETAGVGFDLPAGAKQAVVTIREADALEADNRAAAPVAARKARTVALAGEGGLFLESALKVRPEFTVLRSAKEEWNTIQADLYIWGDGPVVFSLNPAETVFTWPEEARKAEEPLRAVEGTPVTKGVTLRDTALRSYYPVSGGKAALTVGEDAAAAYTDTEAVIGFDLHESNLPLKYDFPVLIQNILNWLLPEEETAEAGERTPLLSAEESDVRAVAPSVTAERGAGNAARGTDLTLWCLIAFLILLLAEMGVSRFVA